MKFSTEQTPKERFDQAWYSLLGSEPFYAVNMFNLEVIESSNVPTFETDGKTLYYSPEFLQDCTLEEIETIDLHEILHIVLFHHLIMAEMELRDPANFDHLTFNMAADYEVNWILVQMGRKLRDGACYDAKYNGWLLADIYDDIRQEQDEQNEQDQSSNDEDSEPGETGESEDNNDDDSSSNSSDCNDESSDDSKQSGNGSETDTDGNNSDPNDDDNDGTSDEPNSNDDDENSSGDCVSNHGQGSQSFNGDMGQIIPPKNDDGEALTQDQIDDLRRNAENDIISAWKFSGNQGKGNPVIDSIIERMLTKKVPWFEYVREYLTNIENGGADWNHFDKRHLTRGMYLPSIERIVEGKICFMVDVSGSVDDGLVKEWEEKINEIISEMPFLEILVIFFHSTAYRFEEYTSDDLPISLYERESGGTDYIPPFLLLDDLGFDPDCVLVLTDLECYRFPETPDFPVLWCAAIREDFRQYANFDVPFGEIVEL